MNNKIIPIENTGKSTMYVNGAAIQPGETRVFNESDLPPYLRPKGDAIVTEEEAPPDLIAELLKSNVPTITEALPNLTDEQLAHAAAIEQDAKAPRKSLLEAMGAENLRRAELAAGGQG